MIRTSVAHCVSAASLAVLGSFALGMGLAATAAEPPTKMAGAARFDLGADQSAVALDSGEILSEQGTLGRFHWLPAAQREQGYSINFPTIHFGWTKVEVRFVPRKTGKVHLSLMGPWEQASPGRLFRQEILWGPILVTGAKLPAAAYQWTAEKGWQTGEGRAVAESQSTRLADKTYLRSWHDGPISFALEVQAGQPVTVGVSGRSAVPAGFEEMRPIASRQTPAHAAAKKFRRGANAGNYLEAPRGQDWGAKYSAADFKNMRAEGFDHVRIPIAWQFYTGPGPDFAIRPDFFQKVDKLVEPALANELAVIINVHHFDEFTSRPQEQAAKFYAIWEQLATHYADQPDHVAFELLNEPKDAATTTVLNPIYAAAIKVIRRTNPRRTIFVGPGYWNSIGELGNLHLNEDEQNVIVTVHCYDPFLFTHQGASWAQPRAATTGILYPGPPPTPLAPAAAIARDASVVAWIEAYNTQPRERNPASSRAFGSKLRRAAEWSEHYGRPVHVGEFGCYIKADPASRARFYADFRRLLDENGLGWAVWDWKAGFKYWDDATGQPAEGMREALFGAR